MYSYSEEIVESLCHLLALILKSADFRSILELYEPILIEACSSSSAQVTQLAIDALSKGLSSSEQDILVKTIFLIYYFYNFYRLIPSFSNNH